MAEYYGTKRVEVEPEEVSVQSVTLTCETCGTVCPIESFYRQSGELNFGHALMALKEGKRVSRTGWNGPGQYVYFVPAKVDGLPEYSAHIVIKTAQECLVPWVPSISDVLAEDWCVL